MSIKIESGIYPGQRNQMFIVLAVFLGFAVWFARDGWSKYPAKNLKWAQQQLPARVEGLQANPQALAANFKKVDPGMSVEQLRSLLGEPAMIEEGTHWYVGPAACAAIAVADDKVSRVVKIEESRDPSESDIREQKYIAVILGIGAVFYLVHLLRTIRTRYVVDDQGLRIGRQSIAWDDMTALDGSEYANKDRVTLAYKQGGSSRTLRLKSSLIDQFVPIIEAICERKGFPLPFAKKNPESKGESPSA